MLATLVYLVGIVLSIWCVLDIFKKNSIGLIGKIILAVLVLAFSWIGFAVYYFIIKDRI